MMLRLRKKKLNVYLIVNNFCFEIGVLLAKVGDLILFDPLLTWIGSKMMFNIN